MTWKPICLELLQYFQERTPGSYIEERGASVVFRYFGRDAKREGHDWEWARRQAAEAQNHIWDRYASKLDADVRCANDCACSLGERFGLRIVPGKTSFLIMPNNISRSSAVGSILRPDANPAGLMPRASSMAFIDEDYGSPSTPGYVRGPTASIDFVLAIGSDQKLLRRLGEMEAGGELDALSTQGFLGGGNGVVGGAETVTTGAIMSDAKWRLEKEDVMGVLKQLVDQVAY
jgi:trehalose-6-phosphatase